MIDPRKWKKLIADNRITILLVITIIFLAWKAYVLYTPDPSDDNIPDKVKDAVLTVIYAEDSSNDNDYYDNVAFGETS